MGAVLLLVLGGSRAHAPGRCLAGGGRVGAAVVDPKVPHQVDQRWAVDFIHIQPGPPAMNGHCSISGYGASASSRSWLRATLDSTMKAGSSKGPT